MREVLRRNPSSSGLSTSLVGCAVKKVRTWYLEFFDPTGPQFPGPKAWWIAGAIGATGALLACLIHSKCSGEEQQEQPGIAPPSPSPTPIPCPSRDSCMRPYQP